MFSLGSSECYFPCVPDVLITLIFFNIGISGGTVLRFVSPRRQSIGSGHALRRVVGCGSGRCVADSGVEEGIVLPASEPNARGAVHAIRSGKVIAVPTDTLYGFACDAW